MRGEIILERSPNAKKKFRVYLPDGKHVDFGAAGYQDYTTHKDSNRKKLYIIRHRKREDWTDPHTAGFWSRYILWNKPSLRASIKDTVERRLGPGLTLKYVKNA